jgi:chromosome partitioning protein
VRLSEAPSHGLPIALYRPESKGAEAYKQLAREVRARGGRPSARTISGTNATSTEPSRTAKTADVLAGIGA